MLVFGPLSSVFDFLTFGVLLWVFKAGEALFQTGWFVESLLTQTLIIHIIRTAKVPFFESRASGALMATSAIIAVVGIAIPFTWLGHVLGFTRLPATYWPALALILLAYAALTHVVKTWFVRRVGLG